MSLAPLDLLRLCYLSLRGNLLRSGLTTLGVFMGVAAVNATLQVRTISYAVIERQLAQQIAPQVGIYLYSEFYGSSLKLEDLQYLKQRLKGARALSAVASINYGSVVYQDREVKGISAEGVSQDFLLTSGQKILKGKFFSQTDYDYYRSVAVINEFTAKELFQAQNPIGQRVFIAGQPFTVIGVVDTKVWRKGAKPEGGFWLPITLRNALTNSTGIDTIQVRPWKLEDIESLQETVEKQLLQRYPGSQAYTFNNVREILAQRKTLELTSRALLVVGMIALLIGGVGIANIAVAAVIERTPEIGLRRAIGATQREIMLQFILEAVMLSLIGGVAAIVTIHGLTVFVAKQFDLPYQFDAETAALALGSALAVGIGAVFVPAVQASRLDPVQALRSD